MPDTPFRYERLAYVALNVTDLDRSAEFYSEVVGMDLEERDDASVFLRCSDNHHDLLLRRSDQPGLKRLGFAIESAADMIAAREHLTGLGIAFRDVAEDEAESLAERDVLRFQVPGCHVTFELFAEMTPAATPFKPRLAEILRLGHCVIDVAEFDETFRCLTEDLGFRISDHMKGESGELAFLRCHPNPYHHSLAIVRSDHNQLHHFALMVRDLDDVGRGTNRLPKAGAEIVFGPGRYVPSGSVFLYFLDPDGITVEYTNGMEEFDEHRPREARKLPPTLDTIDMWGGVPKPGFASVGAIEESPL